MLYNWNPKDFEVGQEITCVVEKVVFGKVNWVNRLTKTRFIVYKITEGSLICKNTEDLSQIWEFDQSDNVQPWTNLHKALYEGK